MKIRMSLILPFIFLIPIMTGCMNLTIQHHQPVYYSTDPFYYVGPPVLFMGSGYYDEFGTYHHASGWGI